ncbi:hypothetical protein MIR68_001127 [Amoeboaphelidium protococcarum]|nr:hypothetical protein MIR68_001127 [Amoeboaphelidium protococcarum]
MGLCLSQEQSEQIKQSAKINQYLQEEAKKSQSTKQCKILLLGAGESGKSTIVKQMRICFMNGYSKDELLSVKPIICKNIYDSIKALIEACQRFEYQFENPECVEIARQLTGVKYSAMDATINKPTGDMIKAVWIDAAVKRAFERSNEFYIMDTAPYFFDNIERVASGDYIPSEDDVLKSRVKSTGITETKFVLDKLNITMYDVGGQRSERKKWIHCFENVTSVIFIVALSEYDQVLLEDSSQNRMAESIILFEAIVNSQWFVNSSFILFLNKIDLFKEKIKKTPLNKYFPEYAGDDDFTKASKFMLWRFKQSNHQGLTIYPHLTCATDTKQIKVVFSAVKDTLIKNSLKTSGIM